jgi:L-iditol 2-dehydrogenase
MKSYEYFFIIIVEMKMLAFIYHGPNDLRQEQAPIPTIGPGDVLVKVHSASICGTDLRIYHGQHRKYPPGTVRIPGHEVAGTLVDAGKDVTGLAPGQRVFLAPNIGCGHCLECVTGNNNRCAEYQAIGVTMDGAFAEYVRFPAAGIQQGNVIPIANDVDPAVAALIEPFACVLRGQNAVDIHPGDTVLVVGAGPIGIMHLKLARLRGAARVMVSEPNPDRLGMAIRMGADIGINPARQDVAAIVSEETHGHGAGIILVAAPSPQAQQASLQWAAIGGKINFFGGLPQDNHTVLLDTNQIHYREIHVTGTTACSTADCWQSAEIINSGRVDLSELISARFPLGQALDAFSSAENGQALKVVIQP